MTGMPYATFYFDSTKAPKEAKKTSSGNYYTSYNSIIMFKPGSREVPMYGKVKLVPFGEKVPLVDYIPFLGDLIKWNVGISSWNEGTEQKLFEVSTEDEKHKIAGVVCIESIYPRFITGFVNNGAELIVVVTNDSWYGNSSGPYQHKEMSALRAIENRRTVVRSANGGISCVIDKKGNTLIETEMFTRASFTYDVELNSDETIYTKTAYVLPVISLIISLFVMFAFTLQKIKKKKND
jgi:apolipoprotein N-acyltransferase